MFTDIYTFMIIFSSRKKIRTYPDVEGGGGGFLGHPVYQANPIVL